jgi:hypothetical protein
MIVWYRCFIAAISPMHGENVKAKLPRVDDIDGC